MSFDEEKNQIVIADNHNSFNLTAYDCETGQAVRYFASVAKHLQGYAICLMQRDSSVALVNREHTLFIYTLIGNTPGNNFKKRPALSAPHQQAQ